MSGRGLRVFLLLACVGFAGAPSAVAAWLQSGSDPLPAVTLLAPVGCILAVVFYRTPSTTPRVHDAETDVIAAAPLVVLGLWITFWTPRKLGEHFFFWRPDLLGVVLSAVAIACLLLGARAGIGMLAVLVTTGIVVAPLVQLLLAGIDPTSARVEYLSVLAGAPLVVQRARAWRWMLLRGAGGIAAGALEILLAGGTHVGLETSELLAGGAAVIGTGAVVVVQFVHARGGYFPLAPFGPRRAVAAVLLAVGVHAVDAPTVALASEPSSTLVAMLSPPGAYQAYAVSKGVEVAAWSERLAVKGVGTALVVRTAASSLQAVATYPADALLTWSDAPCSATTAVRVGATRAEISLYADTFSGSRLERVEWLSQTRSGAERIDVVLGSAPNGTPVVFPALAPEVHTDLVRTATDFLANRHISCGPLLGGKGVVRAVVASLEAQAQAQGGRR